MSCCCFRLDTSQSTPESSPRSTSSPLKPKEVVRQRGRHPLLMLKKEEVDGEEDDDDDDNYDNYIDEGVEDQDQDQEEPEQEESTSQAEEDPVPKQRRRRRGKGVCILQYNSCRTLAQVSLPLYISL